MEFIKLYADFFGVFMIFYKMLDKNISVPEHIYQHEAAHMLLDAVLKKIYGVENYSIKTGSRGKPYLADHPGIFFNLSHCRGLAVCGISDSEIGADCELIRPYSGNAAKNIFSASEIDFVLQSRSPSESFFRIWTLKEALGKAMGTGIFSGLKEYEFCFKNGEPFCKSIPEKIFTQKIIRGKWIISVCSNVCQDKFEEL